MPRAANGIKIGWESAHASSVRVDESRTFPAPEDRQCTITTFFLPKHTAPYRNCDFVDLCVFLWCARG
jgi:hypothetical protein